MQYMYTAPRRQPMYSRSRSSRLATLVPAVGILLLLYLVYNRLRIIDPGPKTLLREFSAGNDEDPTVLEPPVASVQHSVIRGDGVAWTNDPNTTWHSVGRHPNRPACWTYEDRYGAYRNPSPAMTAAISRNNEVNKSKRAMVFRLDSKVVWGPEFILQTRALVLEAGYLAKYDVVILVHLDLNDDLREKWIQRVPEEFHPLMQIFTTKDVRNWLPAKTRFKSVLEQNHLVIQMFMARNQKYEFVYSVEADLRLIGRWDVFLDDVDLEYAHHRALKEADQEMPAVPDLLTFESPRRPRDQWPWLEDDCVAHFGGADNTRAALGVLWGWSRRMTDAMTKLTQRGINCYYEYFAPSVAYQQSLTTFFYQHPLYCPQTRPSGRNTMKPEGWGKNDPRLVQYDQVPVGCTYFYVNTHSQPFWEQWHSDPTVCRPPALVHPVKGDMFN
ncbi:hypothetical protein TWF696_008245 [Orbilia brochopaga]|uniref:Uncharacterized protein n=1 Tax=Orbilia brochopaga TaxID=3140254 RepID=A0AAV9UIY8_9PEZI